MTISKILLWLNAIVFVGFGIACALMPAQIAELTLGAAPATTSAMTDFRAVYGGLMIGVGVFLAIAAGDTAYHRIGLLAVLLIMVGMAGTRALGMLIDGSPNNYMLVYLCLETFTAAFVAWVIRKPESA